MSLTAHCCDDDLGYILLFWTTNLAKKSFVIRNNIDGKLVIKIDYALGFKYERKRIIVDCVDKGVMWNCRYLVLRFEPNLLL